MSDENRIVGIVKNISDKTHGILLGYKDGSEQWWNPIGDNVKKYVRKDIVGHEVSLSIVNQQNHTFSFVKKLKDQNVQEKEDNSYWARKDTRIGRMAALNTAVKILEVSHHPQRDERKFLVTAESLAQDIIRWVENETE